MKIGFTFKDNAPERLLCEAELVFEGDGMEGLKLVGLSLWRSPEGEIYVTFPSRAFGTANERRFFDYLRSADGDTSAVKKLKHDVVEEYHRRQAERDA